MQPSFPLRVAAAHLLLATLLALPALALAQGALTPPAGAPAPSMKSLDQVEPRTPLVAGSPGVTVNTNGGFSIVAGGSYYLTGDLTIESGHGITISGVGITLDLGGWTIWCGNQNAAGNGIQISSGASNIAIHHGSIQGYVSYNAGVFSGGGFGSGISADSGNDIRIEDISVRGVLANGIAGASSIRHCSATLCGNLGLMAIAVQDSQAITCGGTGISADQVANCIARTVGTATAIYATWTVTGCYGRSTGGTGIDAFIVADSCGETVAATTTTYGINAKSASNSRGTATSGIGLNATTADHCLGVSTSNTGLVAERAATGCSGESTSGIGLSAGQAESCKGTTSSGAYGLSATATAQNCTGRVVTGGTVVSYGLRVSGPATGCTGSVDAAIASPQSCYGVYATQATNCNGTAATGYGIYVEAAENCYASSTSGTGLYANRTATGCTGISSGGGYGIQAGVVRGCHGTSNSNIGVYALSSASDSHGVSTSYTGLRAPIAVNCTGVTTSGTYGLYVEATATGCRGKNNLSNTIALHAETAIGCSSATGTIDVATAKKFLGTP